ncbi:MAG: bifunctional diaminohydroxyphosphoribosylaminopyrimidine deaminase/5-amino-6-(5-phosphoribosylamino)uracil reductase RibD [Actinomycetes bacterium]
MSRALALAALAVGATSPNPVVGAVVLDREGVIVGEGYHHRAGAPHAEVEALAQAGPRARGGTMVVTLEPCRHTGRTGPCTQALLAAGVTRLVYAVPDPSPDAGGGAAELAAAGVDVVCGVLGPEAERVNEAWLTAVRTGRPHVTLKMATTLDGRAAAADGTSRWITGLEARTDAHRYRARVDAILVGSGTVLADDPSLTVRHEVPSARPPLRVVVGTRPLRAGLRVLDDEAPSLVLRTRDPGEVLAELWGRGVRSVLLEGGPTLAGAFVGAGLVDRVVAYVAPVLLGQGPAALGPAGVCTIADAVRLQVDEVVPIGTDVRISGRVVRPEGG